MSVAAFNKENKLVESLEKNIPDLYVMMVIDKNGNFLSYYVSEKCAGECNISKLKDIAKLVSIRFGIGEFNKMKGGLDVTINVFKETFLMVREIFEDKILIVAMERRDEKLLDGFRAVQGITELSTNIKQDLKNMTEDGLVKVTSESTHFQKSMEKLNSKRYTLVAYTPKEEADVSKWGEFGQS